MCHRGVFLSLVSRPRLVGPILFGLMLLAAAPAFAQVDLTGVWNPRFDEDNPERLAGPSLVEFLGIPINDYARQWGLAYSPGRLSLPEHQCQVHVVEYIHRGPLQIRMWEERDEVTHQLIAIHEYINTYEQSRTIWMDGRPHPSVYAPHTWQGFSTGRWEGNQLTIETTHLKMAQYERTGEYRSDIGTLREHWIRHGDHITFMVIISDPVYLAEPFIRTRDYVLNPNQ